MAKVLAALVLGLLAFVALGKEAAPASADPELEARMLRITAELRCLVCQNQTIADSHASLAEDLREEVRVLLRKGQSDADVVKYMTDRYGDFVLYRPPVKPTTLLLWYGPGILLVGGIGLLVLVLRQRSRMPDDRFEPDAGDPAETLPPPAAPPLQRST